jgi:hypothetical protein
MGLVFAKLPIIQQREHRYTTKQALYLIKLQSCLALDRSRLNLNSQHDLKWYTQSKFQVWTPCFASFDSQHLNRSLGPESLCSC